MLKLRRLSVAKLIGLGTVCLLGALSSGRVATADALTDLIPVTDKTENSACLDCHAVRGFAVPIGDTGDSRRRSLYTDIASFEDSVHAKEPCISCHVDIVQMPHKKDKKRSVDCVQCHEKLSKDVAAGYTEGERQPGERAGVDRILRNIGHYKDSIHARASEENPDQANANCWDCHGKHDVFPLNSSDANVYRLTTPQTCGRCHEKQLSAYNQSIHGASIQKIGKLDTAVCSDCHTSHQIDSTEDDPVKLTITQNCGNCHDDAYKTYRATYHGQVSSLGYAHTAKCFDCHSPHDTRKVDDPLSMVYKDNRLQTCQECHKGATAGFVSFHPHGNAHDKEKYPYMWATSTFMIVLLAGVFLFFWTHSLLWFIREYKERQSGEIKMHLDENGDPATKQYVRRFTKGWMIAHLVLAIAVMLLVITGTSVLFAESFWAPIVMKMMGGPKVAAVIHRIAASTFGAIFFGHIVVLLHKLLIKERGKFRWFGPDSLLPRWQDADDMAAMFRWFFGKGPRPTFDRWTYWEKFDYWAPFWGMFIIGVSGLMLWFPTFFASFLPGWVFNVATIVHGEEAFLAAVFLFSVHYFNSHFRPDKFPVDVVMFTGSMTLQEFKEERVLEYQRLVEEGTLEQYLVGAPSAKRTRYSKILGLFLIAVGIILLLLVLEGFLENFFR